MNDGLIDALRHNSWATGLLLDAFVGLDAQHLEATTPGVYGSIIGTLWHTISSEAGYYMRLSGEEIGWDRKAAAAPPIERMMGLNDDLAARWDRFLTVPFDAERILIIPWPDVAARDVPAGVILAQVIHHGNEHRSQVATVLTTVGGTVPEWGLWEYAERTGRAPVHVE